MVAFWGDEYLSGSEEEGTNLSARKNKDQVVGPLRKIPRTNKLFLEWVQLISKILRESKKEAIAARKIHLQITLENAVIQSTKEIFHKVI